MTHVHDWTILDLEDAKRFVRIACRGCVRSEVVENTLPIEAPDDIDP